MSCESLFDSLWLPLRQLRDSSGCVFIWCDTVPESLLLKVFLDTLSSKRVIYEVQMNREDATKDACFRNGFFANSCAFFAHPNLRGGSVYTSLDLSNYCNVRILQSTFGPGRWILDVWSYNVCTGYHRPDVNLKALPNTEGTRGHTQNFRWNIKPDHNGS